MENSDRLNRLEAALKVCSQALLEIAHAQEVGPWWFTKGERGLYNQVAMWVRKGREAIKECENGNISARCVGCGCPKVCECA